MYLQNLNLVIYLSVCQQPATQSYTNPGLYAVKNSWNSISYNVYLRKPKLSSRKAEELIVSLKNTDNKITIDAPPSKSIYHRELIVRFLLGDAEHLNSVSGDSDDVLATKAVLSALNAAATGNLSPDSQGDVILPCNESGSTLRFMIPVAAAYLLGQGRRADGVERLVFTTRGRLFDRPLDELEAALSPHGISIEKDIETRNIIVSGEMTPGTYTIDGSVSSQYISGLIMGLSLFTEKCAIEVTGTLKSVHYIELTEDVLKKYGCETIKDRNSYYPICNGYRREDGSMLIDPSEDYNVEGDWSNGAFLLCLKKWTDMEVGNLKSDSRQGDRAIVDFLEKLQAAETSDDKSLSYDCNDIPDIAPYMAVTAAFTLDKAVFNGISRLRIKESDRVSAVRDQLSAAGIITEETEDSLTVYGQSDLPELQKEGNGHVANPLTLSSFHDHRMAMCAVLISAILGIKIELDDIVCINKSFPQLIDYLDVENN